MKYKLPHSAKYFGLNSGVQLNLDTIQSHFQRTYSFNIYKSIGSFLGSKHNNFDKWKAVPTNCEKLFQWSFDWNRFRSTDPYRTAAMKMNLMMTYYTIPNSHSKRLWNPILLDSRTVWQYSNQHLNSHQSLNKSDQTLQRSYNNNNLQMIS